MIIIIIIWKRNEKNFKWNEITCYLHSKNQIDGVLHNISYNKTCVYMCHCHSMWIWILCKNLIWIKIWRVDIFWNLQSIFNADILNIRWKNIIICCFLDFFFTFLLRLCGIFFCVEWNDRNKGMENVMMNTHHLQRTWNKIICFVVCATKVIMNEWKSLFYHHVRIFCKRLLHRCSNSRC